METLNGRLRVEVFVIITINGKRIGIASKGDRDIHVNLALNKFDQQKCQIILCAARTQGSDSWNAAEKFAAKHNYSIKDNYIEKVAEPIKAQQDSSNKKCAADIVNKIEGYLR